MRIAISVRHTVEPLHNCHLGDKKEVRRVETWLLWRGMGVSLPGIGGDYNLFFTKLLLILLPVMIIIP